MFDEDLLRQADDLLARCRSRHLKIATAESCTGGLLAGLLTEIAGSSDVFERGFVTYSNEAKSGLLKVPADLIEDYGAVSLEVASAMVEGTLKQSQANLAVSVTGIAGPGGGSTEKPVGLVYIATQLEGGDVTVRENKFGELGRMEVRKASLRTALDMLKTEVG